MSDIEEERPCLYCGRKVMPPFNSDHAEDCPSNTGIFPVLKRDVEPHGLRCAECHGELLEGDYYATLTLTPGTKEPGVLGAEVVEVVCLVCAAKGR